MIICEKIYFTFEEDLKTKLIYCLRVFLTFVVFVYILYEIAAFLIGIYISYGNQFYVMSLIPAAIMLVVNFFVINIVMLFVSTVFMYNFGYTVYKDREFSFMKVIYWIMVPTQASSLHESIINYRELNTRFINRAKVF